MENILRGQRLNTWFEAKGKTLIIQPDEDSVYLFYTMPKGYGRNSVEDTVKMLNANNSDATFNGVSAPVSLEAYKIQIVTDVPQGACLYLTTDENGSAGYDVSIYIAFQD